MNTLIFLIQIFFLIGSNFTNFYVFVAWFHITVQKFLGDWRNSYLAIALKKLWKKKFQNFKKIRKKFICIQKNQQIHSI